ncbi:hypothetical protein FSP39_013347 [Pinctada imbricata]|uniref:Uncharacterized protein n=1 Tax=Pinctada imbricata TaxID=66713 RepID=A0AA88Y3F1_PINIB|nr:hypothetical protein FSP39_013347 [Pinctada imbricata]
MRSIPTALSALTLEQIAAITTNDFGDCADILGQTDSFSTVQEEALALKAKETWGPTNGWNSSNIDNAGRILQGLSVNDLNTLTLSEDQIFTMGTYEDWEESKKKALFTNYLTLAGHSDASTITGSQLQSLSHIVCGAETSQLSQISPTNYGAAADSIGDLTSCSEQQLTELATLAKTYYSSDITAWTDATITELGIVIGGLPSTDIAQLTESHIDAIESGDIYYLPPTTLSYFSTTQFGYFSSAQAQAVSEGQRNALSSEQISALESAAGISFSTTHSSE